MEEKNPYAAPEPIDEETSKATQATPQSFGQALRQGLRIGFKWGNRVGLTLCGLGFLVVVGATLFQIAQGYPVLSDQRMIELFKDLATLPLAYGYFCLLSIIPAVVVCLAAHAVRSGLNRVRRR